MSSERSEPARLQSRRLQGKVAVVTGAASGIGRAAAELFAEEGAKLFLADLDESGLEATVSRVRNAGGAAIGRKGDVSDEGTAAGIVDECVREYGRLDVYFANAGVNGWMGPLTTLTAEAAMRTLRVNVIGPLLAVQQASRVMRQQGDGGSIIITASVAGLRANAGPIDYSASKAAAISLCQTSAFELTGTGIRVNAICPGLVETGMTRPLFDAARARGTEGKIGQLHPLQRPGSCEEVARAALFLASDESSFVNGQALPVCGGLSASHPFALSSRPRTAAKGTAAVTAGKQELRAKL